MCHHKGRLTEKDKDFLRTNRIKPYDCRVCEQIEAHEKAKKLRIEERKPDDRK